MKIYVAAKFEKKDLVHEIYKKIWQLGHEVSYVWTMHKNIKPYDQNQETAAVYSENEISGIAECDVFIFISDTAGTTLPMEFGAAVMLSKKSGKPKVYAVGEYNSKSPWFFNPRVMRRASVEEVLNEIK